MNGFTRHSFDVILDIYFAQSRFYDASNRQWISRDPVKDGLNEYQYVSNNPKTFVDPMGLFGLPTTRTQSYFPMVLRSQKYTGGRNTAQVPRFGSNPISPYGGYSIYDPVARHYVYISDPYMAILNATSPAMRLAITVQYHGWDRDPTFAGLSYAQMYEKNMDPHYEGTLTTLEWWKYDPIGFQLMYPLETHQQMFLRGAAEAAYWQGSILIIAAATDYTRSLSQQRSMTTTGGTGKSTTRVGRWMSESEYNKMVSTGKVQMSPNGNTAYVTNPADPNAFRAATSGSIYVEFDVPTSSIYPAGNENWGQISGPGSYWDRMNQGRGMPGITDIPDATNIQIIGGK